MRRIHLRRDTSREVSAPPAVEIVWDRGPGGETCIDGQELAPRVQATLGRRVSLRTRPAGTGGLEQVPGQGLALDGVLQGEVQPRPDGRGWIAVVEVRRANAEALRREVTLEAPDCRQLDAAIVLVVALMAEAAQPTPPSRPGPPLPNAYPPPTISVGPDVTVAIGMLPRPAVGLGLASAVTFPQFWQVAAWAHVWPVSENLADGAGSRVSAWTAGAGICVGTASEGRVAVLGCAGGSGGAIFATGVRLDDPHSDVRPYLQAECTAGMRVHLAGSLFARVEVGAAAPIARDSYQFTDANGVFHEVFHTAVLVPLGRLGLEFRAPL
jgi:hypothetical protein